MKKIIIIFILMLCTGIIFSNVISKSSPVFKLEYPGENNVIDYNKYGTFEGIGTKKYKYIIKNKKGLEKAVGEGIYPNIMDVKKNKQYKKLKKEKKLKGSHWDHVFTKNPAVDYFVWATTAEAPGVKLFFTANALKEAGHTMQAIKAYYAIIVHYPGTACFSVDGSFVWYVAPVAIDKIYSLCRRNPELGIMLEGTSIKIKNKHDVNLNNDIVIVNPGKFINPDMTPIDLKKQKIVNRRGQGKVKLVQYKNGHWQMLVNNKPFVVKGITYNPTKIGESPHNNTLRNWMFVDDNKNKKIDAPYEAWVDNNNNNIQDTEEKAIGDFQLLKNMGCNTIRYYHVSENNKYSKKEFNKKLLRNLYKKYGIRVMMCDFLGAYTIGSGAEWKKGTDYSDKKQCNRMKKIIKNMVLDHKDEPYVLMWVLGNENNMSSDYTGINATRTLASKDPESYAKFLNKVAKMIHKLDKNHPVAVGNHGIHLVEYYDKYAPELDILGINQYPDKDGFGALWYRTKKKMDRPILITEYGCDAYDSNINNLDENGQLTWHKGLWEDIDYNLAGAPGDGNSIGGVIFEWLDEWWKSLNGTADTHQKTKDVSLAFPDSWSSEEFLGIAGQGDIKNSPFQRKLRKSYFYYKKVWNK